MLPEKKVKNLIDRHIKLERELSSGVLTKKNLQNFQKNIQI